MMRGLWLASMTLLGAIAATPATVTILPDGTYRYQAREAGKSLGTSTIVVSRAGGIVTIGESSSLIGIGVVTRRELDESNFATRSYTMDVAGQQLFVTIIGNEAALSAHGASAKISAPPDAPFVVNDNMVAGFAQVPATLRATGEKKFTLACVCGTFTAVSVAVTRTSADTIAMTMAGTAATLQFDPQTYAMLRMEVPSQHAVFERISYDPRPSALPTPVTATPVPLPPARYTSRDVSIRADDGIALAATLTEPIAAAHPMPAFLLVHGSGCNDRDETIGPNKIFAQLANNLSNQGYAVLRYDKRSCGKSGGTFPQRDRLIADARDAIAYLRAQSEIDPNRIFVLGHSEGGELAPSIATADGRLRGIVLLAPPAITLEQLLMQQMLRDATAQNRAALTRKTSAWLAGIESGKQTGASAAWLRSSFGIDPATLIAKVPCPILILQGTKDIQVLAADTPRLVNAARAANRRVTVTMLHGDDHLFIKLLDNDPSTGLEYFTPAYLDPALFAAIDGWLAAQAQM